MTSITTLFKKNLVLNCFYWHRQSYLWNKIRKNFFKHKHLFDFSNSSKDSKFYDSQNKMIVDKMKVECKEIPINKFVGLKSKMHSMLSDDNKEPNAAKGLNTVTEFNQFKDT